MPIALLALTAGAFGIGTTEFVIMGLLLQVSTDLNVSITAAGLLISGYALGVAVGAPVLTIATRKLPRKTVLLALMAIFTLGNLACAVAPNYEMLMAARVITSLAHGTFFGVGSVVATGLVAPERRASAIAIMFTGLTAATLLGVPAGAWLGLHLGWRAAFWAVAVLGVLAFAVLAVFVPRSRTDAPLAPLREELAVLVRPQVLLGLAMTVLGFAGVLAVFTYIQPLLTQVTGLSESAVSPVLLVFGGGLAVGNILGGKLADRATMPAVLGTLAVLAVVLGVMHWVIGTPWMAVAFVGLLGVASFATVAPMQLRVLEKASGAGQNLASSLNIAAFNLGNALGAWVGGVVIAQGPGLRALGWVAALLTLVGLAIALWSRALDRREPRLPLGDCASQTA
ncbi:MULTISPECIES: MFS transporter [Variovorax]|jgi:MFS transporter, DHA1 family, inner membrane transport protein|uniref:MFS transporter n=1 Tax=Variovorax TaxID=34072 RepID=UPI00086BDEEC|nr:MULTISPECIES: MFS transporter [Variovorax]MBN8756036.1 MFS transporter [Variovorax sp.]ODU11923.1 MAG: arabinose transporter permease [Variovorax sp. SCN 67-85]ODV14714.1 MAG: arabinose transporter permease [Variovorax sp. SCN 67-20]OJZ05571.1 MAG: MFS transporter [Variovorax sp. 67-131]UKI04972.1 MFS transporter [Variovorax paradoxus]